MNVLILGCGWLGQKFIKKYRKAYKLHATTRSQKSCDGIRALGVDCFIYPQNEEHNQGIDFTQFDVIVSMIPPGLRSGGKSNLEEVIKSVINNFNGFFIFTSSTSVYGINQGEVTEKSTPQPTSQSGKYLLDLEATILKRLPQATIIRPSGLLGDGRNPKSFFNGREIPNPEGYINYIHSEDVCGALNFIIAGNHRGEVFNLSYPEKISRKKFFKEILESEPQFAVGEVNQKRVIPQKIQDLGYEFENSPLKTYC